MGARPLDHPSAGAVTGSDRAPVPSAGLADPVGALALAADVRSSQAGWRFGLPPNPAKPDRNSRSRSA